MGELWTVEETKTLKRMLGDNNSASIIGKALNKTRNSVIGKAHRLGIKSWKTIKRSKTQATPKPTKIKAKPNRLMPTFRRVFGVENRSLTKSELREMFEQAWKNTAKANNNA